MNTLKTFGILTLALATAAARGDTIWLENGYEIQGTVDAEASTEQELVVKIGDSGILRLRKGTVAKVEKNASSGVRDGDGEATPTPAVTRSMIQVHLKSSPLYGKGSLHGVRRPESTDEQLVLEIPGVGITKIATAAIEKTEAYRPVVSSPAPAAASNDETVKIATTHVVYFKKGGSVRGNVIEDGDSERVTVLIEGMGYTSILKRWIEKIDEEKGEIVLPPPAPDPAPEESPQASASPESTQRAGAKTPIGETEFAVEIDWELEQEIRRALHELGRERTRNRVRAENDLRRIGDEAIPLLADVVHHPFNLTRRAAMRVIRDVAHPTGLPLAIDALLDEDIWVRRHAAEAVRAITKRDLGYRPEAGARARVQAHRRWIEYLDTLLADAR